MPVYCNRLDDRHLKKRGIRTVPLKLEQEQPFFPETVKGKINLSALRVKW